MDTSLYRTWSDAVSTLRTVLGMSYASANDRAVVARTLVGVNQAMWRAATARAPDLISDRFDIEIQNDGTFWAPRGYGPLQAVNIDGRPDRIQNRFYQFHANGRGEGKVAQPETFLVGHSATMADTDHPFKVGVVATLRESDAKLVVEGVDANGDVVQTFIRDESGREVAAPGVLFQPSSNMVANEVVIWREITAIRKNESLGPMHVLVLRGDTWEKVAELGPKDEMSKYAKYQLGACPECAGWPCVTGVFKIDFPTAPLPWVMVSSEATLVQLAGAVRDTLRVSDGMAAMQAKAAAVSFAADAALSEILIQQPVSESLPVVATYNSPNLLFRPV